MDRGIDFENLAIKIEAIRDKRNSYNMTITHEKTGLNVSGKGEKFKLLYDILCQELMGKVNLRMIDEG